MVGGALLMDAFEDHEDHEREEAYDAGKLAVACALISSDATCMNAGYDNGFDNGMDAGDGGDW